MTPSHNLRGRFVYLRQWRLGGTGPLRRLSAFQNSFLLVAKIL